MRSQSRDPRDGYSEGRFQRQLATYIRQPLTPSCRRITAVMPRLTAVTRRPSPPPPLPSQHARRSQRPLGCRLVVAARCHSVHLHPAMRRTRSDLLAAPYTLAVAKQSPFGCRFAEAARRHSVHLHPAGRRTRSDRSASSHTLARAKQRLCRAFVVSLRYTCWPSPFDGLARVFALPRMRAVAAWRPLAAAWRA